MHTQIMEILSCQNKVKQLSSVLCLGTMSTDTSHGERDIRVLQGRILFATGIVAV